MNIVKRIKSLTDSPIRKNILVNFLGVGVNLVNQILLVPLYLIFWGNDIYSDWIIISAISSFFTMTDIGLNTVISNRFAIKLAQGNKEECDSLLTCNIVIVTIVFIFCSLLNILFIANFDITEVFHLHCINRHEANIVFFLLMSGIFIGMYTTILNAIYRATHRAAVSSLYNTINRASIAIVTILCVVFHIRLSVMAALLLISPLTLIVIKNWQVQRIYPYHFSRKYWDFHLFKEVIGPSIGFMAIPAGNTIILQGFTLFVNSHFGANAVILYNTTRTLCNFIKTFLATFQNSVWPEYSIAFGEKNKKRMRQLFNKILKISIILSVLIGGMILLTGDFIFSIWTHDKVSFCFPLALAFIINLIFANLWSTGSVTLMATNNHVRFGIVYVSLAVISYLTAHILYYMGFQSLVTTVYALSVCDFTLAIYALYKSNQIINRI